MVLSSRFRARTVLAALVAGAFVVAACTSETPTPVPTPVPPTPKPAPAATPVPPTATPVAGSGIEGGDPEFNTAALVWQGYWLSRDHFGPFVMASGMGIPFQPPMEMMQMAMGMVAQNPNDPAMLPANMMPLQAVFASGGSTLVNDPRDYDPMDFEAFRLDPSTFDETVTVRGQAETMLKESQWAHNFANSHFGEPTGDFGAQQRLMGVMVAMLAKMQGQYAMQMLMGDDGLYHDSDGGLDYTGNWVMLHALSDIAGITGDMEGRYMDSDAHPMFEGAAAMLFGALADREPESAREAAAAVRALAYLASTASDAAVHDAALTRATAIADGKLSAAGTSDTVENAAAIAGLISVAMATGEESYREAADALLVLLAADFDPAHGVFSSISAYTVDDVAWIIGGLNSLVQQGGADRKSTASSMLLAFYEATLGVGGMQLSAPPGKSGAMASPWEMELPNVVYYHPANTPPPPMAGKLTVPAEEITWDGSAWSVTSDRFVPAGAMHLANELNWLGPHLGSIPFPEAMS